MLYIAIAHVHNNFYYDNGLLSVGNFTDCFDQSNAHKCRIADVEVDTEYGNCNIS